MQKMRKMKVGKILKIAFCDDLEDEIMKNFVVATNQGMQTSCEHPQNSLVHLPLCVPPPPSKIQGRIHH